MDSNEPIHPRTLMDHQDFQLRDTARINARAVSKSMEPNALQVGVVMEVSPAGYVMLDDFSSENGDGEWMSVLGRNIPRIGDVAVYGMVKGAPVVLGTIVNEYDPSRITSPNFVYSVEHFHIPGVYTNGNIGAHGLGFQATGGTLNLVTDPGIAGGQGNGWAVIITPAVNANFGMILAASSVSPISLYTLHSFEVGMLINATGSQYTRVGITDSMITTGNNGLTVTYDSSVGPNFMVQGYNNTLDVTGLVDTGLAAVANKLICWRFTKISEGVWEIHYRIPYDANDAVSVGVFEGLPNAKVNFGAAIYNRAATSRSLYIDYMAWAIEGMAGVF